MWNIFFDSKVQKHNYYFGMLIRYSVVAFILISTVSCISTPYTDAPYPKDWATLPVSTPENCPNIDGHYMDDGEWAYGDLRLTRESQYSKDGTRMSVPTLSELLFPGIVNPHTGQSIPRTHISFVTTESNAVVINIHNNNRLQLSYKLLKDSSSCEEGYLVLSNNYRPQGSTEAADITILGRRELRLGVSTDGNLIVFASDRDTGVVITPILLPITYSVGFGPAWGRFQKQY